MKYKNHIDAVRARTGMYIGGTDLLGFINYIVCPFNLLLSKKASRISTVVNHNGFEIQSDANLTLLQKSKGVLPFEQFDDELGHGFEGPILNALSDYLIVEAITNQQKWLIRYEKGIRVSLETSECNNVVHHSTSLNFAPDFTIFSDFKISSFVFDSYLRRISHLYPGIQFHLSQNGKETEYFSQNGIQDMFLSFSSPFQLMHEPIHFRINTGTLTLELILAFHSWQQNWILPFINNGRAAEGGSHEIGLMEALDELKSQSILPDCNNGIIAIMSIIYPDVVWEGCIKNEIQDEKLQQVVKSHIFKNISAWIEKHPKVASHLNYIRTFRFPEAWYE